MNSKSNPIVSLRWRYESSHGFSGCEHALAQWRRSKNFFSTELEPSVETVTTMEGGTQGTQPTLHPQGGQQHKEVHDVRTDAWNECPYTDGGQNG